MKSKDLLEGMSLIDEKYVAEADEVRLGGGRSRGRGYVKIAASLAACLGIAVGGVALGVHYMRQEPTIPPVTADSGTETAGTDTAAPERSSDEDFVIDENGRLLAYTGTATEVYIPETVTEITADAFRQSEVADEIVKVHISSSVSYIDETAFAPLNKVEEFEVEENNKTYTSKNGVLITDSRYIFISPAVADGKMIADILDSVHGTYETTRAVVCVGWAGLHIEIQRNDDEPDIYAIGDISFAGHMLSFEEPIYLNRTEDMEFLEDVTFSKVPETFLMYQGQGTKGLNSVGSTWVITPLGIYYVGLDTEFELSEGENYNRTILVPTGEVKDDKFGYALFPAKFGNGEVNWRNILEYCIDEEEFVREEGYMTFKNGEIVLEPEATYAVKDLFDLDALLTRAKEPENFEYFKENYGWEEDYTLSDVLESNGKRLVPYDRTKAEADFEFETNLQYYPGGASDNVVLFEPTVMLADKFEYLSRHMLWYVSDFTDYSYIRLGELNEKDTDTRIGYELEMNAETERGDLYFVSVNAHGQEYFFEERLFAAYLPPEEMEKRLPMHEIYVTMMETEDAFLFIHTDPATGERTALLFTESGVTDLSNDAYTYSYDNFNERITYTHADGTESGYLTFKDGEPVYNPAESENDSNRLKPVTVISE